MSLSLGLQRYEPVIVDVTRGRIKNAGKSRYDCPIARSFKAAYKTDFVCVFGVTLSYRHMQTDRLRRIKLAPEVCEFIRAYDTDEKVGPFKFTARV